MRLLRQSNVILAINPGKYDSSNYTLVYQKLPAEKFLLLNRQKMNHLSLFQLRLDSLVLPSPRLICAVKWTDEE